MKNHYGYVDCKNYTDGCCVSAKALVFEDCPGRVLDRKDHELFMKSCGLKVYIEEEEKKYDESVKKTLTKYFWEK